MKTKLALITITSLCLAAVSHGAVLVDYEFGGGSTADSAATTNVSGSAFTLNYEGDGGGSSSGDNFFIRAAENDNDPIQFETSLANALTDADYVSFTVTPDSGYQLDLDSLTFDWGGQKNVGFDPNWTFDYGVFSSVGGFASTSDAIATGSYTVDTGAPAEFEFQDIDLSSTAFDNLATATDFRIYFYSATQPGTAEAKGEIGRIDNVTLNGEVSVIPEPSATALLMAALGFLAFFRRRRAA